MKFFSRQFLLELLILFVLSLTPALWLKPGQMLLGHDAGLRLTGFAHLKELFYSWNPTINFGQDYTLYKGFLVAKFPELLTIHLFGFTTGQTIAFIFWFFLMAASMLVGTTLLFPQKQFWPIRMSASLFWVFNMFVLQAWGTAERAKFSLMIALPVLFALYYRTLKKDYPAVGTAAGAALLFFFFNGGGSLPLYGGIIITCITMTAPFVFRAILQKKFQHITHVLLVNLLFLTGFVFVNFYWLAPQAYIAKTSYNTRLEGMGSVASIQKWADSVSRDASVENLLRLQGVPDWYTNYAHPYAIYYLSNRVLQVASILPCIIIVVGLFVFLVRKRSTDTHGLIFLLVPIFIVSYIFTAGTHPPTGFIYEWLLTNIPGFAIFRTPFYKFGPAYWFSFILLMSISFQTILSFVKNKWIATCISIAFCAGIVVYHFPYFVTDFYVYNPPFSTKVRVPPYVLEASDYIAKNINPTSRVLLLPPIAADLFQADSYAWGYWALTALPRYRIYNSIIANDRSTNPFISRIYTAIEDGDTSDFAHMAARADIRYILWRDDVLYSDKKTTSWDLSRFEDAIRSMPNVALRSSFGPWRVYEINLQGSIPIVAIDPTAGNTTVTFEKINPTYFTAHVTDAIAPFSLRFGEQYDGGWRAYIQTRMAGKKLIDPTLHKKADGYANSWDVTPPAENFDMVISYYPQQIFYYSAVVSFIALVGCIVILLKASRR